MVWFAYLVICNEQTHGRHISVNTHMMASMELAMMQVAKTDPNTQGVIWVRPDPWHDWIYGQRNSGMTAFRLQDNSGHTFA